MMTQTQIDDATRAIRDWASYRVKFGAYTPKQLRHIDDAKIEELVRYVMASCNSIGFNAVLVIPVRRVVRRTLAAFTPGNSAGTV